MYWSCTMYDHLDSWQVRVSCIDDADDAGAMRTAFKRAVTVPIMHNLTDYRDVLEELALALLDVARGGAQGEAEATPATTDETAARLPGQGYFHL